MAFSHLVLSDPEAHLPPAHLLQVMLAHLSQVGSRWDQMAHPAWITEQSVV